MSAETEEGSRSYVAIERISGRTEDGREGSVTVQHFEINLDKGGLALRAWSGVLPVEVAHGLAGVDLPRPGDSLL
jgi:hypothetical protein